jgi:hypothetical protein
MHENSIRYQIKQGNLAAGADGKMRASDVAKLAKLRRVTKATDKNSTNLLRVRVLGGAVKARRLRLTLGEAQARVVERDPLAAMLADAAGKTLARVATWPARYADALATKLNLDPADARAIVERLTALASAELGDIRTEMVALCQKH